MLVYQLCEFFFLSLVTQLVIWRPDFFFNKIRIFKGTSFFLNRVFQFSSSWLFQNARKFSHFLLRTLKWLYFKTRWDCTHRRIKILYWDSESCWVLFLVACYVICTKVSLAIVMTGELKNVLGTKYKKFYK
jgi:hypothetical protein